MAAIPRPPGSARRQPGTEAALTGRSCRPQATPAPSRPGATDRPDSPLPRREFARAARAGLGRARLDARRFGLDGRHGLLAAACRRDPRLIREIEDPPARWIVDLARDGGAVGVVRDAAVSAARDAHLAPRDREHVARILADLAIDGDAVARAALVHMCETGPHADVDVAEQVVRVLGAAGWRRVVRTLARRWPESRDADLPWLAVVARRVVGVRAAVGALPRRGPRRAREFADAMRTAIRAEGRRGSAARTRAPVDASLEALERHVRRPAPSASGIYRWARHATQHDREEAWRRALSERSPVRLVRRLRGLASDPAPRFRPGLARLACHPDPRVRRAAWSRLCDVTDARVRALALREVRRHPGRAVREGVLGAFERNGRECDAATIDAAFPRRASAATVHAWADAARKAADPVPTAGSPPVAERTGPAWDALLLRVVEVSPCRACREFALDDLIRRRAAPAALLREAVWDAQTNVRRAARAALKRCLARPGDGLRSGEGGRGDAIARPAAPASPGTGE